MSGRLVEIPAHSSRCHCRSSCRELVSASMRSVSCLQSTKPDAMRRGKTWLLQKIRATCPVRLRFNRGEVLLTTLIKREVTKPSACSDALPVFRDDPTLMLDFQC